jgi:acyl-CoA dehydrogenase
MDFTVPDDVVDIRRAVRELCAAFPGEYWRGLEPDRYPNEFVAELTRHGWLAALIPEEYGGPGLSLATASVILEEICASGGNAGACHAQMYTMGTLLRHGSAEQKATYLPQIASGVLRLQAFGVTEPGAGSDTTSITTRARRVDGGYVVDGQKVWTSRAEHSDLMVLLARTKSRSQVARRTDGLSVFLVDMRDRGSELTIKPVKTMMNHATTEIFIDGLRLPADALIGEEGEGFRYILDGMNAERILIAAECIGDGRFFLDRATAYASERKVFGRPIGANQGVQFPLARAHMAVQAADLMRWKAAWLYDTGRTSGAEANMAKFLASEASWQAANAALDAHGGFGFAEEYDIERKFRETCLYQVAPVHNNLVQAFVGSTCSGCRARTESAGKVSAHVPHAADVPSLFRLRMGRRAFERVPTSFASSSPRRSGRRAGSHSRPWMRTPPRTRYEHRRLGFVRQIAPALRITGHQADPVPAPARGADGHELLRSICGYGDEQLRRAREEGAFGRGG